MISLLLMTAITINNVMWYVLTTTYNPTKLPRPHALPPSDPFPPRRPRRLWAVTQAAPGRATAAAAAVRPRSGGNGGRGRSGVGKLPMITYSNMKRKRK